MRNAVAQLGDRRETVAVLPTPTLPLSIGVALEDSSFGSAPWNATFALAAFEKAGALPQLAKLAEDHRAALAPIAADRLHKRLTRMALAFGNERDERRAMAWLSETSRLLADLPDDILGEAIDQAVKRSERGFLPAVGQIRAIADPLLRLRQRRASRLEAMAAAREAAPSSSCTTATSGSDADTPVHSAAEVAALNTRLRRFGCTTRYRVDGSTFQLAADDIDPADQRHEGASA